MRYIPLFESNGPIKNGLADTVWLNAAGVLSTLLIAAPNKAARDAILDAKANEIWGEVKDWLLSLSQNKCWFSEAEDHFSNRDVEHFRPKKACKRFMGQLKATYEDGYWWLAYDWKNYRICGNVGNAKKGIIFPLQPGSLVATFGGHSYLNENHMLLDPACPADPPLLDFIETGKAVPHQDADPNDRQRVEKTVVHLKLDFEKLEEARAKIWAKCRLLIQQCRDIAAVGNIGPAERVLVEGKRNELRAMVKPTAPFSMTAAACLRKSGVSWAAAIATGA
ncbi:MAG: hypothetical protein WBK51_11370 [Polaromonas sp.]